MKKLILDGLRVEYIYIFVWIISKQKLNKKFTRIKKVLKCPNKCYFIHIHIMNQILYY